MMIKRRTALLGTLAAATPLRFARAGRRVTMGDGRILAGA